MTNSSSLTVSFVSAAAAAQAGQLSVEVDDIATAATSPYPPGSAVVLRLFGRQDATILTTALGGALSLTADNQTLSYTETLTLIKSDSLQLSYPAKSQPVIKWLSINGTAGTASLDPADAALVKFSRQIIMGICEVTYDVSYDKYTASALSGLKALLLFTASDGRDCSTELEIQQPNPVKQDLTLTIKDYSTDAPVPAANVTLTGPGGFHWSGVSDGDGIIHLANIPSGDYTLVATASGYQGTAGDILANDRFTL